MGNNALNYNFNMSVTFNSALEIVTADESFYTLCGGNATFSLNRCISPEDESKLSDALSQLENKDSEFLIIRLIDADSNYRSMLCTVVKNGRSSLKGELYKLTACDAKNVMQHNIALKVLNERSSEYLSLMERVMLHYFVDEDKLTVFMMSSNQQNLVMYSGNLKGWRETLLREHCVEEDNIQKFDALCQTISNGEPFFSKEVSLKIKGDASDYDKCLFKGKTIIEVSGKKAVVAAMSILSDETNGNNVKQTSFVSDMKDPGTDLLNKRAITEYARKLIESKPNHNITIAIIDIDDFKTINDTYGHMFGDEVLIKVAQILTDAVGHNGLCGRIGGDEMFIVVEGLADNEGVRGVLRTIRNNVSFLYHDDERNINKITCSIGSSTWPKDADNYDDLFKLADKVLYLAKEKGKDRYIIYHEDLHGAYVNGVGQAAKQHEKVFFKYRKIEIVNDFIRNYAKGDAGKRTELLEKVCIAFEIDSIRIYTDKGQTRQDIFGNTEYSECDGAFVLKENYLTNFREDGLHIIDNTIFFENKVPSLFDAFSQMGISQAVQFIVGGNTNPEEITIISFNRRKLMKKWAEMDAAYLAILGDLMGLVYIDEHKKN